MELFSLNCPPAVSCLPSSSWRRNAMDKPTLFGQPLCFPSNTKQSQPNARNAGSHDRCPRHFVSARVISGSSSKTEDTIKQERSSKDNNLAFVAGATGRVGSRTVRELLKLGFRVRAGVRSSQRAESLVQSVQQMKLDVTQPVKKLEIIECDLENESSIGPAIGNSSIVICCIGASEKEVFDVTGPYRIDYKATKNLIEAATVAEVDHFILLTSLGTNKIGFPAALLNLFWGVLCWKRKAEEALISSGLPYTIVRPGGMERPTDSYKKTHNIVLANEDTYFGGQVSNLQVAELMAFMAKHRRLSFCKIVEVIAETTAPLTPMEELLAKIPPTREPPAENKPDPVPINIESEPTVSAIERELENVEVPKATSQSPFTMYADLKPPTSPTPTTRTGPGSSKNTSEERIQTKSDPATSNADEEPAKSTPKAEHLSPYIAYADLKPPTSPTPTPRTGPGSSKNTSEERIQTKSEPATSNADEEPAKSTPKAEHLSPYIAYKDLKPPTSPSPSAPSSASVICTSSINKSNRIEQPMSYLFRYEDLKPPTSPSPSAPSSASVICTSSVNKSNRIEQQVSRPLSPYTMYEDLKPPSSPLPSTPNY